MNRVPLSKKNSMTIGNSSEDSIGTDSSYNSQAEENELITQKQILSLDEIKERNHRFTLYVKRIKKITQDKNVSLWSKIYRIFFVSQFQNNSHASLKELYLRTHFLLNADKINSSNQPKIPPYTNLGKFIKYFHNKKFSENHTPHTRAKSQSLLKRCSIDMQNKKQYSLLSIYGVKDPNEIIASVNKKNSLYSKEEGMKKKLENMNFIFNNKHAFQVETEYLQKNLQSEKEKFFYNTFLELKSGENFFERNDYDIMKKYKGRLDEIEKVGTEINNFCENVIKKIDPLSKMDL